MKAYKGDNWTLYQGNMLKMSEVIEENSIDSIVTDPPYELGFMNKTWDNSGIAFQKETWEQCFKVLKSGGYLLAFGGSRTFHRIACAIEDAGFEIRDTIMWLYGSGFPKSMSIGKCVESKLVNGSANVRDIKKLTGEKIKVGGGWVSNELEQGKRDFDYEQTKTIVEYQTEQGKKWSGWGTALKPSYEPIIVARKPCEGSCVDNVLKYGVGGINIDECRVGNEIIKGGTAPNFRDVGEKSKKEIGINKLSFGQISNAERIAYAEHQGRFPANTILTYDETDFDEVCGGFPETKSVGGSGEKSVINGFKNIYGGGWKRNESPTHLGGLGDSGSASRYFYCAKASKRDREEGLEDLENRILAHSNQAQAEIKRGNAENLKNSEIGLNNIKMRKNIHPTVKPTSLMQYLVRLVTPKGGIILDPFNGSGSTGKAVMYENKDRQADYQYIGIELTEEYIPISKARIEYVANSTESSDKEMTLFDYFKER